MCQGVSKDYSWSIQIIERKYGASTHVGVDTTNGNGKHAVKICVRQSEESQKISKGENTGKEASLNGATDQAVEDAVRSSDARLWSREDSGKNNCYHKFQEEEK